MKRSRSGHSGSSATVAQHATEVEGGDDVGRGKRTGGMTGPCFGGHVENVEAHVAGDVPQFIDPDSLYGGTVHVGSFIMGFDLENVRPVPTRAWLESCPASGR